MYGLIMDNAPSMSDAVAKMVNKPLDAGVSSGREVILLLAEVGNEYFTWVHDSGFPMPPSSDPSEIGHSWIQDAELDGLVLYAVQSIILATWQVWHAGMALICQIWNQMGIFSQVGLTRTLVVFLFFFFAGIIWASLT